MRDGFTGAFELAMLAWDRLAPTSGVLGASRESWGSWKRLAGRGRFGGGLLISFGVSGIGFGFSSTRGKR